MIKVYFLLFCFILLYAQNQIQKVQTDNQVALKPDDNRITKQIALQAEETISLKQEFTNFAVTTVVPSNNQKQMFEQLIATAHTYSKLLGQFSASYSALKLELASIVDTHSTVRVVSATFLENRDPTKFEAKKTYKVQLEDLDEHIKRLEQFQQKFETLNIEWQKASDSWKPNFFLAREDNGKELQKKIKEIEESVKGQKEKLKKHLIEFHSAMEDVNYLKSQLDKTEEKIVKIQQDKLTTEKDINKLKETLTRIEKNKEDEISSIKSNYDDPHEKYLQEILDDYNQKTKFVKSRKSILQKEWTMQEVSKDKVTNYYFVCDKSESMEDLWKYLKQAYKLFIDQNREQKGNVYVIVFSDNAEIYVEGEPISSTANDFESFFGRIVDSIVKWGGTDFGLAFKLLSKILASKSPQDENAVVFFITDGDSTIIEAESVAHILHSRWKESMKLFAIGLGEPNYITSLKIIAQAANGCTSLYDGENKKLLDYVLYVSIDEDIGDKVIPIFTNIQTSTHTLAEKLKVSLNQLDALQKYYDKTLKEDVERMKTQPAMLNEAVVKIIESKIASITEKHRIFKDQTQESINDCKSRLESMNVLSEKAYEEKRNKSQEMQYKKGFVDTLETELNKTRTILQSSFNRLFDLNGKMELPPEKPEGWPITEEQVRKTYEYVLSLTQKKVKVEDSIASLNTQIDIMARRLRSLKNSLLSLAIGELKVSDVDTVLREFLSKAPPEVKAKCGGEEGQLVTGEQIINLFVWYFNMNEKSSQYLVLKDLEKYVGLTAILKMNLNTEEILKRLTDGISGPKLEAEQNLELYSFRHFDIRCKMVQDDIKEIKKEIKSVEEKLEECDSDQSCDPSDLDDLNERKTSLKKQKKSLENQWNEIRYTQCKQKTTDELRNLQSNLSTANANIKRSINIAEGLIKKMKEALYAGTDNVRRQQLFVEMNIVIVASGSQITSPINSLIYPQYDPKQDERLIEDQKRLEDTKNDGVEEMNDVINKNKVQSKKQKKEKKS